MVVCVDIGASCTRYAVLPVSNQISYIDNNYVFIDKEESMYLEPYTKDIKKDNLDITIEKDGEFIDRFLLGSLAYRYSTSFVRPSNLTHKYKQKVNRYSLILSAAIAKLENKIQDDNIYIYAAVPPVERHEAEEFLNKNLIGEYRIYFNTLGEEVRFKVVGIKCFEESFLSLLSFFFNIKGTIRDVGMRYAVGYVLSLDIGASTTDLAIAKDMRFVEVTAQTYKIGGNVARDLLIDFIRDEYSFELPIDTAEEVLKTGLMNIGNKTVNVGHLVNKAKSKFAKSIIELMQTYFRKVNVPLQSLKAIVISGGGSMESGYNQNNMFIKTSESVASYIIKDLQEICSDTDIIVHPENPREANTIGLVIRAMIDIKKGVIM